MLKKLVWLTLCLAVIVECAAIIKGNSGPVLFYRALDIHNQQTMKAAEENVAKQRQTTAESMANTAKTGEDMLTVAKEVAENPESKARISKLDQTVSTFVNNVAKAVHKREAYAEGVASLREEIEYQERHWSEIIEKMTDSAVKLEHQKTHDRTMRGLQRKLQLVDRELQGLDAALSRAANAQLAAESLKQFALMGKIGGKLDGFFYQVREANSAMASAATALLVTLHTDDFVSDAVSEVTGS